MKKKEASSNLEGEKGNHRLITISVTEADASRLLKAFAEGKLKDLGIIDVSAPSEMETEAQNKWSNKERRKKAKPIKDELQ